MSASNIMLNRTAGELADSVRRLLGDSSASPAVPSETLRELIIGEYILTQHEFGYNAQVPLRPSGTAMLSYNLATGEYQTTQEGESDIVAVGEIYCDRLTRPLQFLPREELEAKINNDVKMRGAVQQGIPLYWTMRVDWSTTQTQMKNRILVYPAADQATVIYWPRTVVDTDAVDPTNTTSTMPLSYQGTWGLEFKVASICVRRMSQANLDRLGMDRAYADILWDQWIGARDREQRERAMHGLQDFIIERNA